MSAAGYNLVVSLLWGLTVLWFVLTQQVSNFEAVVLVGLSLNLARLCDR